MTTVSYEHDALVMHLSDVFGIEWHPDVMAYEEPHIFRSASVFVAREETVDAEQ